MPSNLAATRLFVESWEVANRLAEMDLTQDVLEEAVRVGELERTSATELDPPSFGGIAGWALTTRTLRAQLKRSGDWTISNAKNLPLTINAGKKIAIATLLGSRGTGNPELAKEGIVPTTKWPKGVILESQVRVNIGQMPMFFADLPQLAPLPNASQLVTWLLLIYPVFEPHSLPNNAVVGSHVAHAELSVPSEVNENGFVTSWSERIFLNPIRLDGVPLIKSTPDDEDNDAFDIPVSAR